MSKRISLSKAEREELTQRISSQSGRADDARRTRLILLLDTGQTSGQIIGEVRFCSWTAG
jgi:hypothetical protein